MGTINDMLLKVQGFQAEFESLTKTAIPIKPDTKGMIDKQCPKEDCGAHFKVNNLDWKDIVKEEECFCPFCRNNSPAKEYLPSVQRVALVKNVRQSIMDNWHHGTPMAQNIHTLKSGEEFDVDIQCEKCNVRFSVIGAAYFCPCCGYNSIERTARNTIEKLILTADKIDSIQKSLEEIQSKDEAAITTKHIIENAVSACIGTLQTFSETKYNQLSQITAPFNAFQNVDKSNKLWLSLKGQGYDQWVSLAEIQQLSLYTQRRHLLEHKGGIVDAKYLTITNDSNYTEGDRLVINSKDIILLGSIILKLIDAIN